MLGSGSSGSASTAVIGQIDVPGSTVTLPGQAIPSIAAVSDAKQAGLADAEAGRARPPEEFDRGFRQKHGLHART